MMYIKADVLKAAIESRLEEDRDYDKRLAKSELKTATLREEKTKVEAELNELARKALLDAMEEMNLHIYGNKVHGSVRAPITDEMIDLQNKVEKICTKIIEIRAESNAPQRVQLRKDERLELEAWLLKIEESDAKVCNIRQETYWLVSAYIN